MSDVQVVWGSTFGDLAVAANDLAIDDSLRTAVILSLFLDRRAADTDVVPDGSGDRRGWWGDAMAEIDGDQVGSRLWLLEREKQRAIVLERARAYALEALQWLISDGIAGAVDVLTEFTRPSMLGLQVTLTHPNAAAETFRFEYAWTAEAQLEAAA